MSKICTNCNEEKLLDCFYENRRKCMSCRNIEKELYRKKAYNSLDAEEKRKFNKKRKLREYGLKIEDAVEILNSQENQCKICNQRISLYFEDLKPPTAVIDHDHSLGKKSVRGILCNACNLGLGLFKDSIKNLQSSIEYLKSYQSRLSIHFDKDEELSIESNDSKMSEYEFDFID